MPLLFCEVERAELGPSLQAEFAMGVRKGREEREGKEEAGRREGGSSREKGRRGSRERVGNGFPFRVEARGASPGFQGSSRTNPRGLEHLEQRAVRLLLLLIESPRPGALWG